jgi:hypothetical protein
MQCPDCHKDAIEVRWDEVPFKVGYCSICNITFLLDGDDVVTYKFDVDKENGQATREQLVDKTENIPELHIGTPIYVDNKEHQFFLEFGWIVDKTHEHYRVEFHSCDERINGKKLWMPSHWIEPIPKHLLRRSKDVTS